MDKINQSPSEHRELPYCCSPVQIQDLSIFIANYISAKSPADQAKDRIIYVITHLVHHGILNTKIHVTLIDINYNEFFLSVKTSIPTPVISPAIYLLVTSTERVLKDTWPGQPRHPQSLRNNVNSLRLPSTGRSRDKRITEHLKSDPIHECLMTISQSLSYPEIIECKYFNRRLTEILENSVRLLRHSATAHTRQITITTHRFNVTSSSSPYKREIVRQTRGSCCCLCVKGFSLFRTRSVFL